MERTFRPFYLVLPFLCAAFACSIKFAINSNAATLEPISEPEVHQAVMIAPTPSPVVAEIDPPVQVEEECPLSREEVDLLALLTMAEAEGECELGKRFVIDTVLNRVDSKYFPNSVTEVIYQKNQFSSIWDGRADRCVPTDECRNLVLQELKCRTSHYVIFFRTERYSDYGVPLFKVEHHYFSTYE